MTIPYITKKQQEIIKLHYQYRFINTKQIQSFLKHKDKKTINLWLKDLREKDYVVWDYDPHTFGENTKLAVYHIGLNGIRFLKTQDNVDRTVIQKLYRDGQREDPFIARSILIAAICLQLEKESIKNESFITVTASQYANDDSPFHFLTDLKNHAPGLVIIRELVNKKRKRKTYYLLDVIDTSLPRYSIRRRMRTYIEFYFHNTWGNNVNGKFPIIRMIAPTKAILIYAKRFAKKALEDNQNPKDLHIQVTTADEIQKQGFTVTPWEEVE